MMFVNLGWLFCLLISLPLAFLSEQTDHRDFQYNSVVDPATGRYNFAYDTGHDNDIAHSLHMQYQDADGIVRGRYGYTDPRGKLRMVEYEAGPNGFVARGDVGPDLFPHGEAPAPVSPGDSQPVLSSYREGVGNDFELDPAPIQMAGWDPEVDPMNQGQPSDGSTNQESSSMSENFPGNDASEFNPSNQYETLNVTSRNALDIYGPELGFNSGRYPRIFYSLADANSGRETETTSNESNETEQFQPIRENEALNVYNIDVDPDEIRATADGPVRRSADSGQSSQTDRLASLPNRYQYVRVPYSYRNYARQTHDHDAETRSRQTHDHDAEARSRQTHDHDAEVRRYYLARRTHDHDAEQYRRRQTHDHDAETRYRSRQTHDHDAERAAYLRRSAYYSYPRRIFYRDSHSMEPHEHYNNPVYRNYRDHQHSDRHLYGRSRNYVYPATASPRELKYIPSDKYHDKMYYWTYD